MNLVNPYLYSVATPSIWDNYSFWWGTKAITGYSGNVMQVRRSSDNSTQNFTATEVTDGTLATFCSGTDGFVSILYDQIGSSNISPPANSNQPQIVSSGTVITDNGQPVMDFDGTDDRFEFPSSVYTVIDGDDQAFSMISIVEPQVTATNMHNFLFLGVGSSFMTVNEFRSAGNNRIFKRAESGANKSTTYGTYTNNVTYILQTYSSGTNANAYRNNSQEVTNFDLDVPSLTFNAGNCNFGGTDSSANSFNGYVKEFGIATIDNDSEQSTEYTTLSARW